MMHLRFWYITGQSSLMLLCAVRWPCVVQAMTSTWAVFLADALYFIIPPTSICACVVRVSIIFHSSLFAFYGRFICRHHRITDIDICPSPPTPISGVDPFYQSFHSMSFVLLIPRPEQHLLMYPLSVVTRPFVKSEPHLGNQMPLNIRRALTS